MPLNTLIEYSDNYSKTSESLWNFYGDEAFLDNGSITNFPTDNIKSASFKFKAKTADRTENDGTKNVKISVPLKYLSNFWRTLKMPLIDCEVNLILTWSNRFFIIDNLIDNQEPTFTVTDANIYVQVVTLSRFLN